MFICIARKFVFKPSENITENYKLVIVLQRKAGGFFDMQQMICFCVVMPVWSLQHPKFLFFRMSLKPSYQVKILHTLKIKTAVLDYFKNLSH